MDSNPNRNVGHTDLSGKLDSVPAPWETHPIPSTTRPGAGPSSTMVTRSRPGFKVTGYLKVKYLADGARVFNCTKHSCRSLGVLPKTCKKIGGRR